MTSIRVMAVRFDLALRNKDLSLFRGAVIGAAGEDHILFHNHIGDGFVYRYPLIQYRISKGRAALMCINEGIEQAQGLFGSRFLTEDIVLGCTNRGRIGVELIRVNEFRLAELDTPIKYRISGWLPFSQRNYKEWQLIESDIDKLYKLESILTGNIISFAKGVKWQIENKFAVNIHPETLVMRPCPYKGQTLIALSLVFDVALFLPSGIGLGKGASLNHGIVSPVRESTGDTDLP